MTSARWLTWVPSLAMLEAERPAPDAKITTFGDALWWACPTVEQKVAEQDGAEQSATRLQVNELTAQVRALQDLLSEHGRTDRQSHLIDAAMRDEPPSLSTNGHAHLPLQFDPGQDLERRGVG